MTEPISDKTREALIAAACEVRARAYSPYSRFPVGAAVLTDDGQIFTGVNIENASYGLTVCAERTAIGNMITAGAHHIVAVAVCTDNGVAPCGACRQVLGEFVTPGQDAPVWIINGEGDVRETTMFSLMPDHFGPQHLTR